MPLLAGACARHDGALDAALRELAAGGGDANLAAVLWLPPSDECAAEHAAAEWISKVMAKGLTG